MSVSASRLKRFVPPSRKRVRYVFVNLGTARKSESLERMLRSRLKRFPKAGALTVSHRTSLPSVPCAMLVRTDAAHAIGGLDPRFGCPATAALDFCLRLEQAGFSSVRIEGVESLCRHAAVKGPAPEDVGLLVHKWGRLSLKFMERLLMSMEPRNYRLNAEVAAATGGLKV